MEADDERVWNVDMDDDEEEDDAYEGPDAYTDDDDDDVVEEFERAIEAYSAEEQDTPGTALEHIMGGELLSFALPTTPANQSSAVQLGSLTLDDLRRMIRMSRASVSLQTEAIDDEDDEDYGYEVPQSNRNRSRIDWWPEIKEPRKEGLELLRGGEFGRLLHQLKAKKKGNNMTRFLLDRSTRPRPPYKEDLTCDIIPNSGGTAVAEYVNNAYVGQFSSDSTFYYTCVRDFRLHVYDTTASFEPSTSRRDQRDRGHGHSTSMKVIKTINAHPGRWTITDSHLSPDNQRMIYASISNTVYMTTTLDSSPVQVPIRFADPTRTRRNSWDYDDDHFGIWSCKFSANGNEVIAGGSGMIFVYDLLADQRTVKIMAHNDDVNSCCWADTASGNVLISASDDTFIKVWDRRSLGSSRKPSGVLIGHTEGITYVSAKGDGRYIISNGKDQVLRLWDLRMMRSNHEYEEVQNDHYGIPNFDYRNGSYLKPRHKSHPKDCSIMQYTGHEVLRTLIRCHFSPASTTGQQYIYSGSADGRIHIWSLDGRIVQVLDRSETLPLSYDPSGPDVQHPYTSRKTRVCVRDVSWHSELPILMSTGWLGGRWSAREGSVIARHEWKGMSKANRTLEDQLEKENAEFAERTRQGALRRAEWTRMPGAFVDEGSD
ncbi:uncharacterized protein FIBRA_00101 [Fibroporia radiculosa]|uniref:Uncharacterized protein n=1 Tax=Fibroporia radiculosa TaxID=599839 RepID=J7RG72_9APHY|nr:uncharacterized protein FIBRA_00101 [Fibroporia radiculosa]CCL98107.1 predicted protein [Fibroporia radiculosa]